LLPRRAGDAQGLEIAASIGSASNEIDLGVKAASNPIRAVRPAAFTPQLYPSKEALDRAVAGMEGGMPEIFEQLDELLVRLDVGVGRS
jgi:hypothetical protein